MPNLRPGRHPYLRLLDELSPTPAAVAAIEHPETDDDEYSYRPSARESAQAAATCGDD